MGEGTRQVWSCFRLSQAPAEILRRHVLELHDLACKTHGSLIGAPAGCMIFLFRSPGLKSRQETLTGFELTGCRKRHGVGSLLAKRGEMT